MPSPREWAHRLEEACHQFAAAPNGNTSPLFLELTERIIREAIAFELHWLAEYLVERVRRSEEDRGGETTALTLDRPGPRR